MPGAVLSFTPDLLPDVLVVVAMLVIEVYLLTQLVPRRGLAPTYTRMIIGGSALLGSAGLLMAIMGAFLSPDLGSYSVVLLMFNFMMLGPPGIWMIAVVLLQDRRIDRSAWRWPVAIAALATFPELLMGLLFVVVGGGALDLASVVGETLTSAWFLWSMGVAMVALLLWIPVERGLRGGLAGLAAAAFVAPWVTAQPALGSLLMAVVMTATLLIVFERVARRPAITPREFRWVMAITLAFLAMTAAGFGVALAPSSLPAAILFGTAMAVVMVGELLFLLREGIAPPSPAEDALPWVRRRSWLVGFLAAGFAADWFMAAGLLVLVGGGALLPAGGSDPLSLLARGVVAFGQVTASPYFLVVMGIEMGAFVVTRIARSPLPEQRGRLALALGSYAVYTVLAPVFVPGWARFPGAWPNLGALGPFSSAAFGAIFGSYAVFALLVLLFGRRAYCSVLCPSAVMYGGEFSQRLIPTIRDSPLPRRHVLGGHRADWARQGLMAGSWGTFAIAAGLSGWSALGHGSVLLGGVDASVFYSLGVWNVTWYLAFVAIPVLGMSPCRTWGWCTTGTLLGFLSRRGRFRLEARDPEVCRACPTHDCGRACEVGLAEMPVRLAREGVFRSSRCVGSLDCVEACPYDNLRARDVRDDLRALLGLPERGAPTKGGRAGAPEPHPVALAPPPVRAGGSAAPPPGA